MVQRESSERRSWMGKEYSSTCSTSSLGPMPTQPRNSADRYNQRDK